MHTNQNPIAQSHQAGIESLADVAHVQFRAVERLSSLSCNFARSMFNDSATYARALLATKDTPELSRLNAALALPVLDRTIAYAFGVCELGAQTQGEMTRLADAHASEFSRSMGLQLEKFARSAPAGADITSGKPVRKTGKGSARNSQAGKSVKRKAG